MKNQKSKIRNLKSDSGFTLIELMVVVSIMVILVTALSLNLAGQRAPRDLRIAENQLVSNIRLAQSYTLSARLVPSGAPAQFYVVKFDLAKPYQYTIQAVYNAGTSPQLTDVQTVQFPVNIQLAAINSIIIDRTPAGDTFDPNAGTQALKTLQTIPSNGCALIAFAAPFGKVIFNGGCTPAAPVMPYTIASDDYRKIVDFQTNRACDASGNPLSCSASTDSIMTITLTNKSNTISKTVTVNAITGGVSFN